MKKLFFFPVHSVILLCGYLYFLISGKNTERAYQALVYLFCHTSGRLNHWILQLERCLGKPLKSVQGEGVLGAVDHMQHSALNQLRNRGFFMRSQALPADVCDRLMEFALTTPATVRPMDGQDKSQEVRQELVSLTHPSAVRYDYRVADLLANPDVQNLLADPSLLALAESYLGKAPQLDVLSMWWHMAYHEHPDSEAAQLYHFDLDRPRWLKVFIYLTDVNHENGPHSFIEGTHRVGSIPKKFLRRGYVRLSDDEVLAEFGRDRELVFEAPRGSVIVEDTIGLHKGGVVTGGARLILQLQFSSSLFGAKYPKATLPLKRTASLEKAIASNPSVYSGYL